MHKYILSMACVLGLVATVAAAPKPVTIVVKSGNPTITVNGQPYKKGDKVPPGATIVIMGAGTVTVGGTPLTTDANGATLTLSANVITVQSGNVTSNGVVVTTVSVGTTAPTTGATTGGTTGLTAPNPSQNLSPADPNH